MPTIILCRVGVTLNIACKICETCRVVGAALIMVGLYLVILGKSEESKYLSENEPIYSVSENNDMESTFIRPLLGNKLQS
ncbi:hypothetical protein Gotur_019606 [Gossypium turneri]